MDLLTKIKAGTDHVKLVPFPGTTTNVALKILSQHDLQMAAFDTEKLFTNSKIDLNMGTATEYDQEKATQILWRALRDPEDLVKPLCASITEFRKLLSRAEKEQLIDEYLTFEKDVSPRAETLSNEEFDKLVSDLKKKPDLTVLSSLNTQMLKRLIITLASQPKA